MAARSRHASFRCAAIFLLLFTFSAASAATEPWADEALPVKHRLAMWLDATRQPAAWKAAGKPPLNDGSALDVWYDGSGHARHLSQSVKSAQPRFFSSASAAAVRFDGENDFLQQSSDRREIRLATIVIAVAPRSNAGGFRAMFSAAETGKNDYVTGINADFGPYGSAAFDLLNAEGRGFGGVRNLSDSSSAFRKLQVVTLLCEEQSVRAYRNGKLERQRDRAAGPMRADEFFLGARRYSNDASPPFVSGFLDGDIAEVLFYDRILSSEEIQAVNAYVTRKHAPTRRLLRGQAEPVKESS